MISTFVGLAIGYGLDSLLNTSPYLTLIFLVLGILTGFIELFRIVKKIEDREERTEDRNEGPRT